MEVMALRYEIINPSDKCFILADDERLAIIACALLGNGMYGMINEKEETVLPPFVPVDVILNLTEDAINRLINNHSSELADVFESFCYESERTSLNDLEAKAKKYAEALRKRGDNNE